MTFWVVAYGRFDCIPEFVPENIFFWFFPSKTVRVLWPFWRWGGEGGFRANWAGLKKLNRILNLLLNFLWGDQDRWFKILTRSWIDQKEMITLLWSRIHRLLNMHQWSQISRIMVYQSPASKVTTKIRILRFPFPGIAKLINLPASFWSSWPVRNHAINFYHGPVRRGW